MKLLAGQKHQLQRAQPPRWPDGAAGTRVLVEYPDPLVRDILERELRARGYQVLGCAGPRPDSEGGVSCPLLHQEHCPAVDGADVVINGLGLHKALTRIGLRRVRAQHPGLPVIVEAPQQAVEEHDGDLADAHLYPVTVERLTQLIDELDLRW